MCQAVTARVREIGSGSADKGGVLAVSFIIYLAIGLVIGFIAYRSSERYKRDHGVTPWRIPSLVWGLIGFISLILCAILFVIAARTTKQVDNTGFRTNGHLPEQAPPPGWYPDPMSQHDFRYWDGRQWTGRVEDGGIEHAVES
jgi:hypothetical protein